MTQENALTTTKKEFEFARADLQSPQAVQQATDFAMMCQKADILVKSDFLPKAINTWQKAVAIMMRAEQLDIDEWTAFQHLPVINGAPQPDGQLCLALIQRSGLLEDYAVIESTDQLCTIRMKRVGQPAFVVTCTWQEYAQVMGPDGKRQPKTHLFWYTAKQLSRRLFSDVLNNMNRRRYDVPIVISDDLPLDDGGDVAEEGEEVAPSAPLSLLPSAEAGISSADDASDDDILRKLADLSATTEAEAVEGETAEIPPVGALNMKSLYERAFNGKLVRNEFHFGNLLTLLMRDGTITERMTADQVIDTMKRHKAEKEMRGETDDVPEATA